MSHTALATGLSTADGLAIDAMGRFWVGLNSGSLVRLNGDGTNRTMISRPGGATANVEFGAGALRCTDVYVATGGGVTRYEMNDVPGQMVPWH